MRHNSDMPGKQIDLEIKQRTRFEYEFFVNDGATPSPNPVDITGRTYQAQMRSEPWGPIVATFQFQLQDQTTPEGKGRVLMFLAGDTTAMIPGGTYLYDVFQKIGPADPDVMFFGSVKVVPAITR